MIVYDVFGRGSYLDSETLERVDSILGREIKRAMYEFDALFQCRGYFIGFSRKYIKIVSEEKYTELSINGRYVYNNDDSITHDLQISTVGIGEPELIFLVPEVNDKGEFKFRIRELNSNTVRKISFNQLRWIPSIEEYKVYKRKYLLGG